MPANEIDRHTYEDLRAASGPEFIRELVDTFLEDAPEQIAEMRSAQVQKDAEAFRRAAHSLKSNSATFGAHRLAARAQELEIMGKENRLEGESGRIDELENIYQDVARELKELRQ